MQFDSVEKDFALFIYFDFAFGGTFVINLKGVFFCRSQLIEITSQRGHWLFEIFYSLIKGILISVFPFAGSL